MIAFVQLPYRSSVAAAHPAEPSPAQPFPCSVPRGAVAHSGALAAYLRLKEFRSPRELGPRIVGIVLSLLLVAQLALVFWLYLSESGLNR